MDYLHFGGSAGVTLAALGLLGAALAAMRLDSLAARRRQRTEEAAHRQWSRSLADASFDGLLVHRQGGILMMNRALVRMLGVREREWLGQSFATLARDDQVAGLRAELEAPQAAPQDFTLLRANKTEMIVELASQCVAFEGQPATATAIRDVTQLRGYEAHIARLTHYDALTGLPNRGLFNELLRRAVAETARGQTGLTLILMDLDNFKAQNQLLGRGGGDALLQMLTARLSAMLGPDDALARLSGDKFAVLLGAGGPPNRGLSLGGQLQAACGEPFIVEGRLAKLSLSVGLAMYPEHAADGDGLQRAAELALEQARLAGGGGLHLYRHEDSAPRAAWVAGPAEAPADDLRGALARGEIRLLYQPMFSLADLSLSGFEALPRWQHPARGLLGPEAFTPLAEAVGLADELYYQLIERACAEAMAVGAPRMALNLLPARGIGEALPACLAAILRKTGLRPEVLEIEMTEALLANQPDLIALLPGLRSLGVGVALDDFGTGASSLNAVCSLPLTRLKIDRRHIAKLGQDKNADTMVSATLSLAANLRLEVTALGVETESTLTLLRRAGCHAAQGKLLGEPASRAVARPVVLHEAAAS